MPSANIVLVTGASAGIGAVYADRQSRRGDDPILVARDAIRPNDSSARLRAQTGRAVDTRTADLAASADVSRVDVGLRQDPPISVLVRRYGAGREA